MASNAGGIARKVRKEEKARRVRTQMFYRAIFAICAFSLLCYGLYLTSSSSENDKRAIYSGPTPFVIATPRGFVDAKSAEDFLMGCPHDFMDAVKKANEKTAREGEKFLAIRVPQPDSFAGKPHAFNAEEATKIVADVWPLGRVERLADMKDPETADIFFIFPEIMGSRKIRDNRVTLLGPEGFMEATEDGFMEVNLDEAPEEVREAYLKMEKESPGKGNLIRVKVDNSVKSVSEAVDATIDTAWKAAQVNPSRQMAECGGRKEDMAAALHMVTPNGERIAIADIMAATRAIEERDSKKEL